MKPVLILDLYGTLLSIPEGEYSISPLARDQLLTKQNPIVSPYLHNCLIKQKEKVGIFEETIEFLKKASGDYRLVCMSNLSFHFVECFKKWKLDTYIHETIFSCNEGIRKPQPVIYLRVRRKYPQSKIYMVGDSYMNDYLIPRELEIESFWLDRREMNQDDEKKRKINPRHRITTLMELFERVER